MIVVMIIEKLCRKNVPDVTNFLFGLCVESGFDIPLYIRVIYLNLLFYKNNFNDQTIDSSVINEMDIT